jgi:hypothetical protein
MGLQRRKRFIADTSATFTARLFSAKSQFLLLHRQYFPTGFAVLDAVSDDQSIVTYMAPSDTSH